MTLVQTEPKSIKIGTTDIKRVTIRPNGTEKQIRPAGWQPGANTVAYYPLDSTNTVNDLSGNGYNLTNSGATFGANYCEVDNAKYLYRDTSSDNRFVTGDNSITCSIWVKILGFNGNDNGYLYWQGENVHTHVWSLTMQSTKYGIDNWGYQQGLQISMYHNYTNWHLITTVYDSSTTTKYLYLDGQLQSSKNQPIYLSKNGLYMGQDPVYNAWINAQISNFIIESATWSAQEISDYYNLTKGNYGL